VTLVLLALVAGLIFATTLTLAVLGVLLGLVLLLVALVFFAARQERKRRMA
jgi:preprotein translocase subunit YajC